MNTPECHEQLYTAYKNHLELNEVLADHECEVRISEEYGRLMYQFYVLSWDSTRMVKQAESSNLPGLLDEIKTEMGRRFFHGVFLDTKIKSHP